MQTLSLEYTNMHAHVPRSHESVRAHTRRHRLLRDVLALARTRTSHYALARMSTAHSRSRVHIRSRLVRKGLARKCEHTSTRTHTCSRTAHKRPHAPELRGLLRCGAAREHTCTSMCVHMRTYANTQGDPLRTQAACMRLQTARVPFSLAACSLFTT